MKNKTKSPNTKIPLCVDLDGTLIRTDMLYEAVFKLLRMNLGYIFLLPIWWWQGKANLKEQIAQRVMPDVTTLPYRDHLITWLKQQKADGRKLVLATAGNYRYADAVAAYLRIFDEVKSSSATFNLSGKNKAKTLVDAYGAKAFDYIGNGSADIPVWDESREAITIGHEKAAIEYANKENARRFSPQPQQKKRIKVWLKALRVHQWLKNSLLFVPAILSFNHFGWETIQHLIPAFLAFSFCASSVYLLNDLTDIDVDRKHKTKCKRPIPAGFLPAEQAAAASVFLLIAAFALSFLLPFQFTLVLGLYYLTTCAYSFGLKRMLLIDVLTLSGLFTIRVLAGAVAVSAPISTWLLAFSMFFFLSLALVKRFVEVSEQLETAGREETGRGYQAVDLETLGQSGVAAGFARRCCFGSVHRYTANGKKLRKSAGDLARMPARSLYHHPNLDFGPAWGNARRSGGFPDDRLAQPAHDRCRCPVHGSFHKWYNP